MRGMDILQATFPEKASPFNAEDAKTPTGKTSTANPSQNLDEAGEFLIEINEGHTIADIQSTLDKFGITHQRAFHPSRADFTDLDDFYVLNIPNNQLGNLAIIEEALYKTIIWYQRPWFRAHVGV